MPLGEATRGEQEGSEEQQGPRERGVTDRRKARGTGDTGGTGRGRHNSTIGGKSARKGQGGGNLCHVLLGNAKDAEAFISEGTAELLPLLVRKGNHRAIAQQLPCAVAQEEVGGALHVKRPRPAGRGFRERAGEGDTDECTEM